MKLKNKFKRGFFSGKSLFLKYMNVSVLIIFVSFLVLGIILTLTISTYWTNEKKKVLNSHAENISKYIRPNVTMKEWHGAEIEILPLWIDSQYTEYVKTFLTMYSSDVGVDIIVTDLKGNALMAITSKDTEIKTLKVDQNIIDQTVRNINYYSKGTLGGAYTSERYSAAYPVYTNANDTVVGTVIVSIVTDDVENVTRMVFNIFLLAAIATLSMSILAIGLFSYNMIKPLKQMAQAAKQFGKGDFSVRVNASSNDEIGELAASFNNMAESLSSSEITRKSFVANVSHELKTPMTTIAGFIDGILDGTIPPEKQNYYLHIVSEEIKRLSRLVRSMLDLSRIDSGELKLNYQKFDLLDMLVTIIITFEREIENKNIEIKGLDEISPKIVYGDKDLIYQVVYNLIENAVKFTNEGGYIEFRIDESLEQFDFIIKNSGMGIKKSEIDLVFGRFYKTDK
ncbi:MAG: HAMP domain-containing histidine kinase, partial [Clostridia bacterium]|nr:HAMP domain-containing histidine kinase [Clostridia bacterium]